MCIKFIREPQYVKRWINAPIQKRDGSFEPKQGKGTPQGGVISPLLADIFLAFAFDTWFEETFPECSYERYATDIIIQSVYLWSLTTAYQNIAKNYPNLFLHWKYGFPP